jgi:predicted ATPase
MLVKEKLSGISLYSLIPQKSIKPRILIKDEPLLSSPFIISQNRSADSKFTGRIKELDYLRTLYSEAISHLKKQNGSAGQFYKPIIAAVGGEPGIGKSRLINEFIKRIKANSANEVNNFLYGRNLSTQQQPNGMFTDIVKPGGFKTGSTVKNENNAAVNNLIKETIFKTAFEVNKLGLPLVIAFEDMQWADESSISAFEHILRSINLYTESWQPQIFFIINYRNKFKPSKTLRTEADYREISLDGFTEKETEAFIINLTGGKAISGKTREIIRERSDGNPFNIEEWCSLLGESKKLSRIPESIRQLLVEKVTNLLPEERSVLIIACVLGRKFDLKILRGIQKRAGKEQATLQVMQSLMDKRYLVNLSGDIYEFRHDILQETIYRQLITELKQNVHLLAGNAIEELFTNKISDYYYELARHYTAAKNETKSIEYLEKAGDKAKDNYEHERALRYYSLLLKFITGDAKYKVTFKICDVHMNRSEWNKQIELCNSILNVNRRLDKLLKAECYKRIGNCLRLKGDYKEALLHFSKAKKIVINRLYTNEHLDLMENEARILMNTGNYSLALNKFIKINTRAIENEYWDQYRNSLICLGIVNTKLGKYDEALRYNEILLVYGLKNNDKGAELAALGNTAEVYTYMGENEKAYSIYLRILKVAKIKERFFDIAACLGNLGTICFKMNNLKLALKYFEEQIKYYFHLSDKPGISRAYGAIGCCYLSQYEYIKATKYLKRQLSMSKELRRKQSIAMSLGNLGVLFNRKGEFKKAFQYFKAQQYLDEKLNYKEGLLRGNLNFGILFFNLKKYKYALKRFQVAINLSEKYNIKVDYPMLISYYFDVLYEMGCYDLIIEKYQNIISNIRHSNDEYTYSVIISYKKAVICSCKKKPIVYIKQMVKFKSELLQIIKKHIDIEAIALIYYNLWKVLSTLNSDKNKSFRRFAIKYYKLILKRKPEYRYKYFLNDL